MSDVRIGLTLKLSKIAEAKQCEWCTFAVLEKVKGPSASVSQAKSQWTAPISDFIVSDDDDDVDDGDSDSDVEAFDYHSPLQMIRSTADKENEPSLPDLPDDPVKAAKKPGIVQ